jgi:hypothetical protein
MPDKGDLMVAYKQSLTTDEHAALPEAARGFYKQVGSNYVPDIEGVDNLPGLTSALASERTARETAEGALKPFKGYTPERLAELTALEQSSKLGKLTSKGEYDQALAQVNATHTQEKEALNKRLADQALDHGLDAVLLRAGVIDNRLGNAKLAAKNHVRVAENGTLEIIGANGQPAGVEVDKFFTGDWKTNNLYFFNGNGGAGSGSTGGGNQATGEVPTKTRAEFNALTPQQKADFSELVGQGKAQLVAG